MKSILIQAAAGFDCLSDMVKIHLDLHNYIAIITETKVLDTSMTFKTKVTIFRIA